MQYLATFRIQVRTAGPSSGQGQRAADDLLPGGQRSASRAGGAAGHGDARRGGGRRNRRRMSGGQAGAVAQDRKGVDGFRLKAVG